MSKRVVRVVWGRLRTDWAFLVACWLLVATATTLVTAGALYADTVELGGVRRALAEANPADQGVLVRLPAKADQVGELDGKVRPVLQNSFDEAGADVFMTARSASLEPADGGQPGIDPAKPIGQQLTVLGSYENLDQHASIVDGRWPDAGKSPMEAAISEKAAAALGLRMGSRMQLADAATPLADPSKVTADVQIVGIWRPNSRGDAYWLGDSLDLDGVAASSSTTRGPLIVAQKDLLDSATQAGVELRWRALPHVNDITLARIADLRAAIGGIAGGLAGVLPAAPKPVLNTNLANVLGTIDQSVAVSRAGVVLVILQFVLLAGYAVLLAGALLVERRRPEVALFRARGARGSQVGALAIAESLAIAIPAAIVAPFVALLVINFIGNLGAVGEAGIISAPSLSASVLLVTLLATLACVAVMSLPALVSDVDLAHVRASIGRPLGRTMAQRIGLDIVLLAVTAIGLYQLQSYGTPLTRDATGSITLDPVLVAAPALALAAGALLVIRLVPRIGEIADRLFDRQSGLTLPLASNEIARRPLRYTRTALLIVLATALATFAATYTSTWADSQAAQAAYQTAADIRLGVNPQSDLSKSQAAGTLTSIDGVSDLMPLTRDTVTTSRRTGSIDILMLDAKKAADEVGLSSEAQQRNGAAELAAIASDVQFAGLTLPPGSKRLGVVLDINLKPNDSRFPIDSLTASPGQGVGVRAQVSVGGTDSNLNGLAPTFDGTAQRVTLDLPAEALTDPDNPGLLLGLSVSPLAPIDMGGDVTAVRFEVSPSDSGDADWTTVAQAADLTSWGFEGGGNSLHFDDQNPVRPSDNSGFGDPPEQYAFTPANVADPVVPVIASDGFLAATGTAVGDDLQFTYHSHAFPAKIAGSLPNFPSLDPAKPFLIVDRPTMRLIANDAGISDPPTNEWWLWVNPGAQGDVADAITALNVPGTQVTSELRLRQSLERDPVALGLVGALILGSLAAAACAAVGLIVGAIVSTRERRTETALLRALGMSRRGVTTGVAIDNAYLLAFSLPAGMAVGILLAMLILPHTPLNRTGTPVVPTPWVVIPVEALAGLAIIGLVLLVITVFAASRTANRMAIADVLRAGDN